MKLRFYLCQKHIFDKYLCSINISVIANLEKNSVANNSEQHLRWCNTRFGSLKFQENPSIFILGTTSCTKITLF